MYPFYYPFENSFYGSPFAPYYSDPNALFQLYAHAQEARPDENIPKSEEINTNYSTNDPKPTPEPHAPATHSQPRRTSFPDANSIRPPAERKVVRTSRASSGMRCLVESKQAVPKFRYTHKNFESNIINKIFSFLWSEDKSRCFVMRIVGERAKCSLYYDYIKIVRKYCKRYINKEYLLNLCEYNEEHIAYRIVVKQTEKLKYFSMAEFSTTIRKLILLYLRNVCATSILTSKKMRKDIWREHFEKMRNIRDFLFGHLSPQEYDQRMSYSYDEIYRKSKTDPNPIN